LYQTAQTQHSSTNTQAQIHTSNYSIFGPFTDRTSEQIGLEKQTQPNSSNSQENTERSLLPAMGTDTGEQQMSKDELEHRTDTNDQQLNQEEVERFKTVYAQEVIRLHGEMADLGDKLEQLRVRVFGLHDEVIKKGFTPELSAYVQQLALEAPALPNTTSGKQDMAARTSEGSLLKHIKG
jgi:hypothetical protein